MLMLKNIKHASAVRVEGRTEDIEVMLDNGNMLFSQVKSVSSPHDDFSNVISKLKDSLRTLNAASTAPEVERLIYISNSPNPFNDKTTMGAFSGGLTILDYDDLPSACKQKIEDICAAEQFTFDRKLFSVFVMQFHGNTENRYKIIKDLTNEFLNSLGLGDRGLGANLLAL